MVRGKDTVVAGEIDPGFWRQSCQAGYEIQRIERHLGLTVPVRRLQDIDDLADVCDRCGRSVKVIACIEDQDIIDSILAHLREKERGRPTLSHLVPPSRAPSGPLPLKVILCTRVKIAMAR